MRTLIYLTHWRVPSEKTMTPLILKTCEGFVKLGFTVELWTPKRRNEGFENIDAFEKHKITTRFPIRQLFSSDYIHELGSVGFLLMVTVFNVSAFFALRRRPGSIVYAHDLRDVIVPCMLGYPVFVEIHDFFESRVGFLNRFVLRRVAGLIVTNSIKQRRLSEAYGVPASKMIWQPNAVDVDMFSRTIPMKDARQELGLPHEKKIVLYAGHLFSWKGVHTLAEAAEFLPDNAIIYFVGGTVEDRESLQRFVRERGLARIEFVAHQEHAKMPLFLQAADVVVLPNTAREAASKYETSPVKLFEYLASGRPIVVSDLPSIREIVTEKEVFFAQPDDPKDFARVIESVLHGPKDLALRQHAAQACAAKHTWEARAENIARLIKSQTASL